MQEQDALFAAILEAPDDDAPRLVYADWLDEHGQPERAEFIRVQVELSRLPEDGPLAEALKAREGALLKAHADRWCQELPAWARRLAVYNQWERVYERGLPAAVITTAREFLKGAAGLFRRAPIRRVELRHLDNAVAVLLAACPHLAKVSALAVGENSLTDAGWRTLLGAPGLAGLTELRLHGGPGPDAARVLASSPHLARLQGLTVHYAPFGDLGLQELAASAHLAGLRDLRLIHTGITDEGARALAGSPLLSRLTALALVGNALSPAGSRALAGSPHQPGLAELELSGCPIRDEGAQALSRWPGAAGLKVLKLTGCGIEAAGARALAESPYLANLTRLELDYNQIRDEGVRALASSPHLGRLAHLRLRHCGMTEEGARALAESPRLTGLRTVAPGAGTTPAQMNRFLEILRPRYVPITWPIG